MFSKIFSITMAIFVGCFPMYSFQNGPTRLKKLEQQILKEINQLRSNPKLYIDHLIKYRIRLIQKAQPRHSQKLKSIEKAIRKLHQQKKLQHLTLSNGLNKAATDHAADLLKNSLNGHIGSDRSNPFDRMNRYGRWKIIAGENISTGQANAQKMMLEFLTEGLLKKHHLENLLQSGYKTCGISCISRKRRKEPVCVINFTGGFEEVAH